MASGTPTLLQKAVQCALPKVAQVKLTLDWRDSRKPTMVTPVRNRVLIFGPAPYSASNLVTETAHKGTDQRLAGMGHSASSASPRGPPLHGLLQCASSHLFSWPPHRRHQGTHGVQPCTPPHARTRWVARSSTPCRVARRSGRPRTAATAQCARHPPLFRSGAARTPPTPGASDA